MAASSPLEHLSNDFNHAETITLQNSECDLSRDEIVQLATTCVRNTPSMFNVQSTRVVVLFGDEHRYLWSICRASLSDSTLNMRPNVAHEHFNQVSDKLATLQEGFGTALFFEDTAVIEDIADSYPAYAPRFPTWSQQSSGIAQYAFWLAMTEASPSTGMTLQHYLPDMTQVRKRWDIPEGWEMTGQMPFGRITAPPIEKVFRSDTELCRTYG